MTTAAKQPLSISLPVSNWLKTVQRFSIVTTSTTLPEQAAVSTLLRGAASLAVPALVTRDYKLHVQAYVAGKTSAEVRFLNEETGEYLDRKSVV